MIQTAQFGFARAERRWTAVVVCFAIFISIWQFPPLESFSRRSQLLELRFGNESTDSCTQQHVDMEKFRLSTNT